MQHAWAQPIVTQPNLSAVASAAVATPYRSHPAWTGPPALASGRVDRGALGIGACLRGLCVDLARRFDRQNTPSLSCTVADHLLPADTVVTLRLITDLLVSNAYINAFAAPEGGRIAVSFRGLESAFQLTIEDSGRVTSASVACRADGLAIAALLVRQLGGRIETPRVVAGSRAVVTLPRRRNGAAR